jgi:hypothetical protein
LHTRGLIENLQMQLRGTDRDYYDLAMKLGKRDVGAAPVSLRLNAEDRAAIARQAAKNLRVIPAKRPSTTAHQHFASEGEYREFLRKPASNSRSHSVGYMTKVMRPG